MLKLNQGRFLILMLVVVSYAIFSLPSILQDGFKKTPQTYYQSLTAGFLAGQLSMTIKPSPQLLKLANPYDPKLNQHLRYWDTSLYNGKLYLYFGPLPIVTFYLPFKLLTGYFPPRGLVIFFFSAIGFLFNFLLLIKIKEKYFATFSEWQLALVGCLLGLGNNLLYFYLLPEIYDVAIISAYCLMCMAMYYLFDLFSNKTNSLSIALFATCLALSVAGRPDFVLVNVVLIPATILFLFKYAPKDQLFKCLSALFVPVVCVGTALALYNYMRFDSIFEFGLSYQLGDYDYRNFHIVHMDFYRIIPLQLYYYFIQPIFLNDMHPIPKILWSLVNDSEYEVTIGILTTTPIIIAVLLLPKLWVISAKNKNYIPRQLLWFATCSALIGITMLSLFIVVRSTAQRYELNFLPYLLMCSIVTCWLVQQYISAPRILMKIAKLLLILTSIVSILIGINFGMLGYRFSVNVVILSALTRFLFLLMPAYALLTYFMLRMMVANSSASRMSAVAFTNSSTSSDNLVHQE